MQPTYDFRPDMGKKNTVSWYFPDKEPYKATKIVGKLPTPFNTFFTLQYFY